MPSCDLVTRIKRIRWARGMLVVVAEQHGLKPADIIGRCRDAKTVKARVQFIHVARAGKLTSVMIGRIIKRAPTSVLYHSERWLPKKRAHRAARLARAEAANVV